jgi:hypothetical protein
MNETIQLMREHLEARDIEAFLTVFESARGIRDPELAAVTQRIFPSILREQLERGLAPEVVVHAWRLIRYDRLVLVEDDVREAVNHALTTAWPKVHGADAGPPEFLQLFRDLEAVRRAPPRRLAQPKAVPAGMPMKRIVVASAFTIGRYDEVDSLGYKKSLCASSQEREFLFAVRQYFPTLLAHPNVPLRNFLDLDAFVLRLSDRHRAYARAAQVDVLLCTPDEDPVAGIELDSVHHDQEERAERDQLKNELFQVAGMPLVRLRAVDTTNVRAEDFYDLLCAEADALDKLRPRRLRPRRSHDMLVPAESEFAQRAARAL